jgi:hypothetical protein
VVDNNRCEVVVDNTEALVVVYDDDDGKENEQVAADNILERVVADNIQKWVVVDSIQHLVDNGEVDDDHDDVDSVKPLDPCLFVL